MLIEFTVENFLSFKDSATLSMVAAKPFKEYKSTHTINVDNRLNILKSAIIYGNNASGKSNLLESIGFMRATILTSFRDALVESSERPFPLEKFALNSKSEVEPSSFEIAFIHENRQYRYGFEIDTDIVVSEWLFHTTSKETPLFTRDLQKITVNKSSFKEGIGKESDVKENVLFLSLLATLGKEISSRVVDWFKKVNFINGVHDRGHKYYTINRLKTDSNFFKWTVKFIKFLEIANLETAEQDTSEINLDSLKRKEADEEIISLLTSIHRIQSKHPKQDQLVAYHRKYDENNVFLETVAFNFDKQESEGTKKLLYLLGPWHDSIENNRILVVDELDSRLHSHLTKRLIEFFHVSNSSKAQLICAVHDVSILNKELFRRDQIWFVEKNQFGASELVSLGEFSTDKVRNNSSFNKNYLEGKYGAIPYFDENESISFLPHEQEG